MNPQILGILAALGAVAFVVYLLRRGVLPERFAGLWIIVSAGLLVVAIFPGLLGWAAEVTGVEVPLNLLLFAAAVMLLLVSVQLSFEIGRLEARTRRLAEEIALLLDLHASDRQRYENEQTSAKQGEIRVARDRSQALDEGAKGEDSDEGKGE